MNKPSAVFSKRAGFILTFLSIVPPALARDTTLVAVPEPSTYGLIGVAGLIGLAVWRHFKK